MVGIGLLYRHGCFRQVIDRDDAQQALYPFDDPGQLPVTPVWQPNGELLRLAIEPPGDSVWLRAWSVQVGRRKLFLPDSKPRRSEAARAVFLELTTVGNTPWRLEAFGSIFPHRRTAPASPPSMSFFANSWRSFQAISSDAEAASYSECCRFSLATLEVNCDPETKNFAVTEQERPDAWRWAVIGVWGVILQHGCEATLANAKKTASDALHSASPPTDIPFSGKNEPGTHPRCQLATVAETHEKEPIRSAA